MKLALLVMSLCLFACSAESDDSGTEADDSVLYDAAREPLDKAEAAKDAAEEAKAKVDAALEEGEGPTDD